MFVKNKYFRWYNIIIERSRIRNILNIYTENHHIIPRCLGGDNSKKNIATLTAREHFICHLLLTKFTVGPSKKKMDHAAFMLTVRGKGQQRYRVTNRQYEVLKTNMSNATKGIPKGPAPLGRGKNISKAKKGIPLTEDHKKALTGIKKGRPWTEARKKAGCHIMTPFGIFSSMSEAERQLRLGANVISYRIKTKPNEYYRLDKL